MPDTYYETRIKCDVLNELRKRKLIDSRSIVASEYVLGAVGKRADLAVFNGEMRIGIEIKSRHDTLNRLHSQLSAYSSCFDSVMLFVDTKHTQQVDDVPDNVAVFSVDQVGTISALKAASSPAQITKSGCLQLLTAQEMKKLLGLPLSSKLRRSELIKFACELPNDVICESVNTSFARNFEDTSRQFWLSVGRGKVNSNAISLLSRYASVRKAEAEKREQRITFWEAWSRNAREALQSA